MNQLMYLAGGLLLAWAAVFGYLWSLARRARSLQRQLEALSNQIDKGDPGAAGESPANGTG